MGQEEQMQIESLVTQEIHKMTLPELKSKIIKLAQAYRGERLRNEEFEKAKAKNKDDLKKLDDMSKKMFSDLDEKLKEIEDIRE